MLESVRNIFSIPDLRKRVLYTFLLLGVYRVGANIPIPGVDTNAILAFFEQAKNTLFGLFNLFSGGAMEKMTIFALGIMPNVSASIILQLLTVVWPYLERLSKEGELGRRKITQYTRYGTVLLSVVQAMGIAIFLENSKSPLGQPLVTNPGLGFRLMTILTLTTGTAFIMWLGEQISERGVGTGISLIIFAGIVVGMPTGALELFQDLRNGTRNLLVVLLLLVFMVAVVGAIVFVERGQRRIPVQYAKRVVGRRLMGGQSTHLPLRVNTGGVIPVIFASSIITVPQLITSAFREPPAWLQSFIDQLRFGMPLYNLLYVVGIVFFCYFYTSIIFNPLDVADNMKKYGGFIPGIRPGKRTADYIDKVLSRLTLAGAVYLCVVALVPEFLITGFKVQHLPWIGVSLENFLTNYNLVWIMEGFGFNFYFGGTSLLIVVGVAMDTVNQIESQLIMRHYDGFFKGGSGFRIRGRRG
jgi:preprotein translocase subunit SecY